MSDSFPPLSELARPGKRARVAMSLDGFHGPTSGRVELPHRMFWQANRVFDLDQPFILQWMYEIVLREALTADELRTWLDVPTLHRLWAVLYLPHGVRRDWERHHPSLRDARLASPEQANPTYERWLAQRHAGATFRRRAAPRALSQAARRTGRSSVSARNASVREIG